MNPQPKNKRWQSQKYLKWVRSLACSYCGKPADHAHHITARGMLSGMGIKPDDFYTMPVCAECHSRLHQGSWTNMLDEQWRHIAMTLGRAIHEGILRV